MGWILKMAWRDSRGSRKRLLLFLFSMVLGIAALVAINSFGQNLEASVSGEARTLLGGDLELRYDRGDGARVDTVVADVKADQARRITFTSMARVPATGDTRLATIRAIDGAFPFYGTVETEPADAAQTYQSEGAALVDSGLMRQLELNPGDSIQVGRTRYAIAGRLLRTSSESAAQRAFSPRIYIPLAEVDSTLLGAGSRVDYERYLRLPDTADADAVKAELQEAFGEAPVRIRTAEQEMSNWGTGFENLYRFLSLVGFIALLLGGLGVASAVHVYVKQRLDTVAVLRCVGASAGRTFGIYLTQAVAMGVTAGVLGGAVGVAIQQVLPLVLADFLPVEVDVSLAWSALGVGMLIGVGVTVLFALLPLLRVRNVSPLRALRAAYAGSGDRDPLRVAVWGLIGAAVLGFAVLQAPTWWLGAGYAAGVAVVFGLLALVARGLMWAARRFAPTSWSYPWRQGLANLHRPNNQTSILMLALGLGTFLILTLVLVQRMLLTQIEVSSGEEQPNLVLFDIQPQQVEQVSTLVRGEGLPVLDEVPVVSMRLAAVEGRTVEALREDPEVRTTWAHRREYRSTYRDHLIDSETIVAGSFTPRHTEGTEPIPVSLEEGIAEELNVGLGDQLTFDVQGRSMTTEITSLRAVDWQRVQTNFFVVFPEGVLETAPQFSVLLTRTDSEAASSAVQSAVVEQFPNVSAIDLSLILSVAEDLFERVAVVIRFMALFSILTGLIVLIGAVAVSRYQRVEESVLLKTLGASRAQVFKILLIEYLFLGVLASLTGIVLSLAGAAVLAFFVFDAPFVWAPDALLLTLVVVTGLTAGVGLLNSRGLYNRPPLEVLRAATT